MTLLMTAAESFLFQSFLRCADRYLEFGAGGSTELACALVKTAVTSVESSQLWTLRVRAACALHPERLQPNLVHADIGETYGSGYPIDDSARNRWHNYHTGVWTLPEAARADLYLVDGRFRVACFIQTLLHAAPSAMILIHDYADRPEYHVIEPFAVEVARAQRLSAFRPRAGFDRAAANICFERYAFDTF